MGFFERFRRRQPTDAPRSEKQTEELAPPNREVLAVIYAHSQAAQPEAGEGLDGTLLARRVANALKQVGNDVLAVGRPGMLAGVAALPLYRKDARSDLTALVTGLKAAVDLTPPGVYPLVVFVGLDQPFVRVETLRFLLALSDADRAIVPVDDAGVRQTSCAVYPSAWFKRARSLDNRGMSLAEALEVLPIREVPPAVWRGWGEDGRSWFQVRSVDELRAAENKFG